MKKTIIRIVSIILFACMVVCLLPKTEAKAATPSIEVDPNWDPGRGSAIPLIEITDSRVVKITYTLLHYNKDLEVTKNEHVAHMDATPSNPLVEFTTPTFLHGQGDDTFIIRADLYGPGETLLYRGESGIFSTGIEGLNNPTVAMSSNGQATIKNMDSRSNLLYVGLQSRPIGVNDSGQFNNVAQSRYEIAGGTKAVKWDSNNFVEGFEYRTWGYTVGYPTYRESQTIYSEWKLYDPNCKGLVDGTATIVNADPNSDGAICKGDAVKLSIVPTPGITGFPKESEQQTRWQSSVDGTAWNSIPRTANLRSITITDDLNGKYIRCIISANDCDGEIVASSIKVTEPKIKQITFKGYGTVTTRRDGTIDISNWPTNTYPGYYINRWMLKTAGNTAYIRPSSTHVFNTSITISPEIVMKDGVDGFVARLYKICLDRYPDKTGFNNWKNSLINKTNTGVSTAYGFIFSPEFQNKNFCNSDYVEYLYKAIMGRPSDKPGKKYWIEKLETGSTREEVFNGFVMSQEFKGLCEKYGIALGNSIPVPKFGTIPKGACAICNEKDGVTQFVERLYYKALDRTTIDKAGLNNWCNALWDHQQGGSSVASGFFFSSEFINKKLSNEEYVKRLYRVLMGREPDTAGFNSWVNALKNGQTRVQVFQGFAGSQEWDGICKKYGILK